ncbi:uncharacterized protein LOC141774507 [Sebastes fasciatus]|uniref:uncharacterized protein LOC141774507 n=1 Tax=Sebastes fasciatus TaxID=394691 RepID=UPI003D9DDAA9
MADLTTLKNDLTLIVSNLAEAVMTEMFTAKEKVSLRKQNPKTEEKLKKLVDSLCVQAVDKILKMVKPPGSLKDPSGDLNLKDPLGGLKDPPGGLKDPPGGLKDPPGGRKNPPRDRKGPSGDCKGPPGDRKGPPGDRKGTAGDLKGPPESDESSKCLVKATEGGGGGGGRPPSGQTYFMFYRNAAADSKFVLVPLPNHANANANGENKPVSTLHNKRSTSTPSPQADFPDHEYARPPPGTASSVEGGVSAGRRKKRPCSRRPKKAPSRSLKEPTGSPCQCSQCGMMFPNAERLSDHQKSHPTCSVCGATFRGILRLRQHTIKEHGLLPYNCDYCHKTFNHKAHRDLHVKARHTGEKTCHCDICGKGYSCVSLLKTHKMTHFEKTFVCDVCGKSFYHACHLKRHKLVHREVRPYQCSTCGKGFNQAANLRSHEVIHTGEKPLCSICGKSYRSLRNHVISKHPHELPADELSAGDAIITCEVCGRTFASPSQFKIHQRSHTGEKPYRCEVCGKSYGLKQQLREHRYTHTGEKPYKCSLCSKTFNLATSYMRHRSIHTGETPHSCLDCGKQFRLLTFLKAHRRTKAHLKQVQQRKRVTSNLESDSIVETVV